MKSFDVAVVGAGLLGACVARELRDLAPELEIAIVDSGPAIGSRPGLHLHDDPDPKISEQYRDATSAGIQPVYIGTAPTGYLGATLEGVPGGVYSLRSFNSDDAQMPGAGVGWNFGGMGVHWTAAVPAPWGCEVFGRPQIWEDALSRAQTLMHARTNAYDASPAGRQILDRLNAAFSDRTLPGREAAAMPMAMEPKSNGSIARVGPALIFEPLGGDDAPRTAIYRNCLCLAVECRGGRAQAVRLRNLWDGRETTIKARQIVICADALRTPQILWNSGIRPAALGRGLNEHAFLTGRTFASLDDWGLHQADLPVRRPGENVCGSYWLPHSGAAQPTHGSLMDRVIFDEAGRFQAYQIGLSWYVPLETKLENRIVFSDNDKDATGMPRIRIEFAHSADDVAAIERGRAIQLDAGRALGACDRDRDTAVLDTGSSLHLTGTTRMGDSAADSVVDLDCRVHGLDNLWIASCGVVPTALAVNATLAGAVTAVIAARGMIEALK